MNDLKFTENGNILLLNISLLDSCTTVKNKLDKFGIQYEENKNCFFFKRKYKGYELDFICSKRGDRINKILFSCISKDDSFANIFFDDIKKMFDSHPDLFYLSYSEGESFIRNLKVKEKTVKITGNIIKATAFIQHGLGENYKDAHFVTLSWQLINETLYFDTPNVDNILIENYLQLIKGNNMKRKYDFGHILKILVILLFFILIYLFALNGRYEYKRDGYIRIDKWTNTVTYFDGNCYKEKL